MGQEIKTFKALGRENRILCLIVEGEPNASDRPDSGLLECFPEAVRYHFDELGQRTLARTEPIAADLRDGKDGKTNARLKIVAGVVGVSFDELRQREKRRRLWRRIRYAFGALALLAAIGATWFTFTIRQIREEDFDAGLRELLNARPDRAAPYLAEAYSLGIDSPTLRFLLPQALRPLEIEWTDLTGHRNNVISVRYSDDGERLATGSVDRTARIWDASGKPVRVLEGHTDTVGDAAFSPDGSRVVTSSTDRTAIVWDLAGTRMATLSGHAAGVASAVFSPDGARVLTVSDAARLWDPATGRLLHAFEHRHSFGVHLKRLTFSPDGRRVVLPGPGAIAQVWNTETGELVFALDAKEGGVATAVYSPDGSRIVTSGKIAQVWDAATGTLLGKLEGHTEQVVDAEFGAKDGLIVTASWDGTAKVWGPDFGARRTLGGHRPNLQSAQFSPDGTLVITRDATGVKVWDATTGRLRAEYDTRAGMSRAAASPKTPAVASPMLNNQATIMHVPNNGWSHRLIPRHGQITAIASSVDGARLAFGGRGGASLWDVDKDRRVELRDGPGAAVNSIELSADGARLLATMGGSSFTVWDTLNGRALATLAERVPPGGFPAGMLRGSIHPDGSRVVVAGTGRNATVWDLDKKAPVHSLVHNTHGVSLAQYSPDGSAIVTADLRRLYVWEAATGKALVSADAQGGFVDAVAFSRDGRRLASLDDQGSIKLWDASTLRLLATLRDVGKRAVSLAFRSDGAFLVTAHSDGSVKFWDGASGMLVYSLDAAAPEDSARSPWGLRAVAFTADGAWLIAASGDIADFWDAREETRNPAQVAAFVRCVAPWMIKGGKLVERAFDPNACR